jgi:hypothetical protein
MKRKVVVNDRMQKGYIYDRTAPARGSALERHDPRLNYFGVNASQSLAECDAGAGSIGRIRADGFSGTAGITWDAGRETTRDRSGGGVHLLRRTAAR